jgi:hypothetical protein
MYACSFDVAFFDSANARCTAAYASRAAFSSISGRLMFGPSTIARPQCAIASRGSSSAARANDRSASA